MKAFRRKKIKKIKMSEIGVASMEYFVGSYSSKPLPTSTKHTVKFHCVGIATLGAQYFYITQIWAMLEFNYNNIKQPHKYLLYNIRE